jgi:RHS repeat-associated protein
MSRLTSGCMWAVAVGLAAGGALVTFDRARPTAATTRYEYDPQGRLTSRIAPTGLLTRYAYDRAGLMATVSYHTIGGVTGWTYPARSSVHYQYDLAGNRVSMRDASRATEYSYDDVGRISAVATDGSRIGYEYDAWQRVRAVTYPGGARVEYRYDVLDRVTAIVTSAGTIRYQYDERMTTRTLPNGISTTREFEAGRLHALVHRRADGTTIGRFDFEYDADARLTVVREGGERSTVTRYEYDAVNRLAAVVNPDGTRVTYRYDVMGNRLAETGPQGELAYAHDDAGRLRNAGSTAFFYDRAGNLSRRTGERRASYRYDDESRLVEVKTSDHTIRYHYDGDGDRVAREMDGSVTRYLNASVDGLSQVVAEQQAAEEWSHYVFGDTRTARIDAHGQAVYFLEGPLSSTQWVVDGSGSTRSRYGYTAFGVPTVDDRATPFQYAGEAWDAEAGLLYLRARYYDPTLGRFITADPIQGNPLTPATFNQYVYANSDPVNNIDPRGLQSERAQTAPKAAAPPVAPPTKPGPDRYTPFTNSLNRGMEEWALAVHQRNPNWMGKSAIGFAALDYAAIEQSPLPTLERAGRQLADAQFRKNPVDVAKAVGTIAWEVLPTRGVLKVKFAKALPLAKRVEILEGGKHWTQRRTYLPFIDPRYPSSTSFRAPLEEVKELGDRSVQLATTVRDQPDVLTATKTAVKRLVDPLNLVDRVKPLFPPPPGGGEAPAVGGVYLDQTAAILGELGAIVGASYDADTGRLILIGDKSTMLPSVKAHYLAAALKAVYAGGRHDIGMTIDPDPKNPDGPTMIVRYFGGVEGTELAFVMFESDRQLKGFSAGADSITKQTLDVDVEGYRSLAAMLLAGVSHTSGLWSRFWLVPEPVTARVSDDGRTVLFDPIRMRVNTETMRWVGGKLVSAGRGTRDEAAEAFAAHFTEHYDDFARRYPVYEELRQVTAAVALAKWVHAREIPLNHAFVNRFIGNPVATPVTTPSVRARHEQRATQGERIRTSTIEVFGGVEMEPQIIAIKSDAAQSMEQAVAQAWSAAGGSDSAMFSVSVAGKAYTAVALPSADHREAGGYTRVESDLRFVDEALLALPGFTRHYSSFHNESSEFGRGWTLALPRLDAQAIESDGQRSYLAVEGKPGTRVLVQRFTLQNAGAFNNVRFEEPFIDQELGRIGFRPKADGVFRGVYPRDDGSYDAIFTSGSRAVFDAAGHLRTIAFTGGLSQYDVDAAGHLNSIRVVRGRRIDTVRVDHDNDGRIVRLATDADTAAYAYGKHGHLERVNGSRAIEYAYDSSHRLVDIAVNGASEGAQEYDLVGHLTRQHHKGQTLTQTLEGAATGKVVVTTENGVASRTAFDRELRPVRIEDGLGKIEERSFDAIGRIARIDLTLPTGGRARLTVSPDRGTVTSEDPRGIRSEYRFAASGELQQIAVNGRQAASYRYAGGRRVEVNFADGSRESYGYGTDGEMVWLERVSADGERERARFVYDKGGSLSQIVGDGERVIWNGERTERAGATDSEAQRAGSLAIHGDTIVVQAASGSKTKYTIDVRGRLASVGDAVGVLTRYVYDHLDRLIEVRLPNGQSNLYEYDGNGESLVQIAFRRSAR